MKDERNELELLRSVALQNAKTIAVVREKAALELREANAALEQANGKLANALAMMRATLESTTDAILAVDPSGKITTFNEQYLEMWHLSASHLESEDHALVVDEVASQFSDPVEFRRRVAEIQEDPTCESRDILESLDGRVIERSSRAQRVGDRIVGRVWCFREVTTRVRAEQELQDASRRKDEFLAILAHELRNPLAPIRQAAKIVATSEATKTQVEWSQSVIERQVRHMTSLLEDLLDVSRITRGQLTLRCEPTDLTSAIDAAMDMVRPQIDAKEHRLTVDIRGRVSLNADPVRLAQIIANLLTNAAKYTEPHGEIRLTARCVEHQAVISVTDSGMGMDTDLMTRMFGMFERGASPDDSPEGGLGIGLALVRGLVELHGGVVDAASGGRGRGSTFTVRIPLRQSDSPVLDANDSQRQADSPESRRVLVADDNSDSADSLAMLLRLRGYDVRAVYDGASAVAEFERFHPDSVVLDIGMPKLDGYEAAQRIRRVSAGRAVKLIAVTGWGQDTDKRLAADAGFDTHLTKPVDPEQLMHLL